MDGLSFHKILKLIKRRWLGATLNRATILGDQLYFSFYMDNHFILTYRSSPPPSFEIADAAQGEANGALALLSGSKLSDVGSRLYDRVGWFDLEKRKPSGKLIRYRFILEPMGNYANAFLLNEQDIILYSASSRSIDPDRNIGVGKKYSEPRANKKFNLLNLGEADNFLELTGFYPTTATLALQYQKEMGFFEAAKFIRNELETNDNFYLNQNGKIVPFPPINGAEAIPFEKISFQNGKNKNIDNSLLIRLNKFYTKHLRHYERLKSKISDEYYEAEKWSTVLEEANLIKANLHIISKRGIYKLQKYTETGIETIEYDYTHERLPSQYADKLFRMANKLKRSVPILMKRLAETDQLVESAKEQIFHLGNAEAKDLKELSDLIKKPQKRVKRDDTFQSFIEYKAENAVFYLGRNSAGNHKVVFLFANPNDMWLHARNIPSAHCIIRKEGGAPLTEKDILFAARLVAFHSKSRKEAKIDVDYTRKKYVKKPKSAPAGFVVYTNFNTITVSPFNAEEALLFSAGTKRF